MTAEQVNTSLVAEVQFLAPADGDVRSSRFVLRQNPEIAAWLLTILDYVLFRHGQLAGERRIADPPGGDTLQRFTLITQQRFNIGRPCLGVNRNVCRRRVRWLCHESCQARVEFLTCPCVD